MDQGSISIAPVPPAAVAGAGREADSPAAELQRFAAGMRAVTALLSTLLLFALEPDMGAPTMLLLLAYGLWSAWVLWSEMRGTWGAAAVWPYWVDVAWAVLAMKLLHAGTGLLVMTMVNPVVVASIGFGTSPGLLLALFAAAGMLLDQDGVVTRHLLQGGEQRLPALLVLAVVPAVALLAQPLSQLRRRRALIDAFEAQVDPRRGLEPICADLVERLRDDARADVVALVLPVELGAPASVATRGDGSFRVRGEAHSRLESLLAQLPDGPVSYIDRARWDPRRRVHRPGHLPAPARMAESLAALAVELEVHRLQVVPLTRYGRRHGHIVVGYVEGRQGEHWDAPALAAAVPGLLRVVEQAALVDQLQDEIAGHERARIGRDLHDSAIQPYLGLKYAVETLALRIAPDNPARAEVDALATLVNGEVAALRELISGLRTGGAPGDSALVPAVRRQVRRFAQLFGIRVDLECPDELPTTRALAGELFHLVNEALNNVRRHSGAQHASVTLDGADGQIRLTVRDDGGSRRGRPAPDYQPVSLATRVAELGGSMQISRPDGVNTELDIRIPM